MFRDVLRAEQKREISDVLSEDVDHVFIMQAITVNFQKLGSLFGTDHASKFVQMLKPELYTRNFKTW